MKSMIVLACSVCFGDPASPLNKAVVAAIFVLAMPVLLILSGIVWTAFRWMQRARRFSNNPL